MKTIPLVTNDLISLFETILTTNPAIMEIRKVATIMIIEYNSLAAIATKIINKALEKKGAVCCLFLFVNMLPLF